jgi:DNA-directed RNA polymerase specialized sigma24 family protein
MEISTERTDLRSRRIEQLESRFGEPIEKLLTRLYYDEGLTQAEVAKRLRVPAGTVGYWMARLGINQRAVAARAAKERSA